MAKGGNNLVDADDETRHEVRIVAKKLRYAAEFFEPLYKSKAEAKRHRRFITAMEDLQDLLGSLNDLATAPDMLAALELSDVAGAKGLFSAEDKSSFLRTERKRTPLSRRGASGVDATCRTRWPASRRNSGLPLCDFRSTNHEHCGAVLLDF
ncbi:MULTISPECIES: CHAD domain-containing protein [unclassified Mesorhizobium]|uniref:CHAD domain-containing protein n=1 Tax=unclassified Mesorhizobium TaxID=325217 RepID=UPI000463EA64|nr:MULTISPECIES: CHAD domain-containing protein [unclassified Mesorhizobium]